MEWLAEILNSVVTTCSLKISWFWYVWKSLFGYGCILNAFGFLGLVSSVKSRQIWQFAPGDELRAVGRKVRLASDSRSATYVLFFVLILWNWSYLDCCRLISPSAVGLGEKWNRRRLHALKRASGLWHISFSSIYHWLSLRINKIEMSSIFVTHSKSKSPTLPTSTAILLNSRNLVSKRT